MKNKFFGVFLAIFLFIFLSNSLALATYNFPQKLDKTSTPQFSGIIWWLIAESTSDFAQWKDSGGTTLGVINYQGNMGLGTDDPESKLTVVGAITIKGTTGGFSKMVLETTTAAMTSGSTANIDLNIPSGANILGVQLRVDTTITGATTWSASFSGGNTSTICIGESLAQNTKVNSFSGGIANAITDITITAVGSDFTAGVIRAIVYYEIFVTMTDN